MCPNVDGLECALLPLRAASSVFFLWVPPRSSRSPQVCHLRQGGAVQQVRGPARPRTSSLPASASRPGAEVRWWMSRGKVWPLPPGKVASLPPPHIEEPDTGPVLSSAPPALGPVLRASSGSHVLLTPAPPAHSGLCSRLPWLFWKRWPLFLVSCVTGGLRGAKLLTLCFDPLSGPLSFHGKS